MGNDIIKRKLEIFTDPLLKILFRQGERNLFAYLFPILVILFINIGRMALALSLGIFDDIGDEYPSKIYSLKEIYLRRDLWLWLVILAGVILTKFFIEKLPFLIEEINRGNTLEEDDKKRFTVFLEGFQKHLRSKVRYILVIILIVTIPVIGRITTYLTPLSQLKTSSIDDIRVSPIYGTYSFFEKCFLIYVAGQICFVVVLTAIYLYKLSKQFNWNINLFKPKGGLKPLADISFLLDLFVFVGGMAMFTWFLIYLPPGFSPYLIQYILFLSLYLIIGSLIFFLPILPLHQSFVLKKKEFLEYLSEELARSWRVDGGNLLRIKDEIMRVSIFPGNETILKYGTTIGIPFLSMILQIIISLSID